MPGSPVGKETVSKSKDDIFSSTGKQIEALAVDASLAKQLNTISASGVNSEKDCIAQTTALDQRRTEVQKRGGLWHAFEKVAEAKKYSDYGMQFDSPMNRLVFSLKYLSNASSLNILKTELPIASVVSSHISPISFFWNISLKTVNFVVTIGLPIER